MRRFLTLFNNTTKQVSYFRTQQFYINNNNNQQHQIGLNGRSNLIINRLLQQQQQIAHFSLSTPNFLFGKKPSNPSNSSGSNSSSSGSHSNKKNNNNKKQFNQNQSLFEKAKSTFNKQASNNFNANNNSVRSSGLKVNKTSKSKGGDNNNFYDKKLSSSTKNRMSNSNSVKHNIEKRQFFMDLGNNMIATIDYRPIGKEKIEMYHTEVPIQLRNRGIGKALAKGSLEHAKNDNLKVKLTCEYLINYLDKFADPKHKSIIVD